jgi:hypothetical protein
VNWVEGKKHNTGNRIRVNKNRKIKINNQMRKVLVNEYKRRRKTSSTMYAKPKAKPDLNL